MTFYEKPSVTVDIIVFTIDRDVLQVLLIQRKNEPFRGKWAIPGGFVDKGETLERAAAREMYEETNVKDVPLYQFHTFGDPGRDPRGWTISVAFYSIVEKEKVNIKAMDDAQNINWFSINNLPELAFDHNKIINVALSNLRKDILFSSEIIKTILSQEFHMDQLLKYYEIILDKKLNKDNFENLMRLINSL